MAYEKIGTGFAPQNMVIDLAYSIAMFVVGLVGLRFTVKNVWGIDLLDMRSMPGRVAAGFVSLVTLYSVYEVLVDPNKARKLGRRLVGSEYNVAAAQASSEVAQRSATQLAAINAPLRR